MLKSDIFNGGLFLTYWISPKHRKIRVAKLRELPFGDGNWMEVPPGLHYFEGSHNDNIKLVPVDEKNWDPERYRKL